MFFWEFREIFQNTYFGKHLHTAASEYCYTTFARLWETSSFEGQMVKLPVLYDL